jgi:uncharacterized protein (DUF1330 family)
MAAVRRFGGMQAFPSYADGPINSETAAADADFTLSSRQTSRNNSLIGFEEIEMPAYWVARSKVNDPTEYKKYTDRVPGILAKYGGKVLARGGRFKILEGPEKFHRFVVIEFPSREQAVACHDSPEYREAAAFRRSGAGEVELVIVEGA